MGGTMSLQYLKNNQEVTFAKNGPVERRIRKVGNLFQVYDVHWTLHKCQHIGHFVGEYETLHAAGTSPIIFLKHGIPLIQNFARSKKRNGMTRLHNKLSRLLENRIFYKSGLHIRRTQLVVILGGKSLRK